MKTPEIEKMESLIETVNIAANLDEDKLKTIGRDAQRGFESDLQSRQPWLMLSKLTLILPIKQQNLKPTLGLMLPT